MVHKFVANPMERSSAWSSGWANFLRHLCEGYIDDAGVIAMQTYLSARKVCLIKTLTDVLESVKMNEEVEECAADEWGKQDDAKHLSFFALWSPFLVLSRLSVTSCWQVANCKSKMDCILLEFMWFRMGGIQHICNFCSTDKNVEFVNRDKADFA